MLIENTYKDSEQMAMVRTICDYVFNFSGMGRKEYTNVKQYMPIPLIDNVGLILPIRSLDEAKQLIKELLK